jgi:hypothetical protein
MQIYLDSGVIHFKFNDWVRQRSVGFQSATPVTVQDDDRFCTLGRSVRLRPLSNKRSRLMQRAHFRSHTQSVNQRVQKNKGSWLTSFNIYLILFTHAVSRIKKQGAPDWRPLISVLCFLHTQHHVQKVRGSRLMSHNIYLILFIYTAPRTKSKRLLIDIS